MRDTLRTPIYSPLPFDPCDPKQVIETAQHQEIGLEASNTYSLLPWTLEDLPGTTWCHVPGGLPMQASAMSISPALTSGTPLMTHCWHSFRPLPATSHLISPAPR